MTDEEDRPTLDYQTPRRLRRRRWRRSPGPDSFLGSSALFFAVLTPLTFIAGLADGTAAAGDCCGVPLAALAAVLGFAGLLEQGTSKTFPLAAIALAIGYVAVVLLNACWR